MNRLENHPTVKTFRSQNTESTTVLAREPLPASWLRRLCLEAGADDVGFVAIDRSELDDQREDIVSAFPRTKYLISFIIRMNPDNIRAPQRSIANVEFHHAGDEVEGVARKIIKTLSASGVRGMYPSMGFPMETQKYPSRMWMVSHKPIAIAAGLGRMGIHRNVIHPRFGNFILLGTLLIDCPVSEETFPIEYNPCLECKLCVAACPVGAIAPDGNFNFSSCYTHNYREFLGGFLTFTEQIADSRNALDLRSKVSDSEGVSWWQSLAKGPNYKAAYCLAVCPAGEDVIGTWLENKKQFLKEVVEPLTRFKEEVYVTANSDAEDHVKKYFPQKKVKRVPSGLRPVSIESFLKSLPHVFHQNQSQGLNAVFGFSFAGEEKVEVTIEIRQKTLRVKEGSTENPDVWVRADSRVWIGYLRRERSIVPALLMGKIKIKGSWSLLKKFERCFPI